MDNLVERFKDLKKTINSLSEKKAKLEGKKEQKLFELKEKYGIINIERAKEKLEKLAEQDEVQEKQLEKSIEELDKIVEKAERISV